MKKLLLSTTAALVFAMTTANAQSTYVDQIVTALEDQNYESIEIKTGPTQIKLEAIRNGMKLEAVYDAGTGVILKQEVGPVEPGDDFVLGVTSNGLGCDRDRADGREGAQEDLQVCQVS